MKHIIFKLTFVVALLLCSTNLLFAQSKLKTDTITVNGNCGQCKERIEDAAYIKGVKQAEWDITKKVLTVIYNIDKISLDKITKAIAKAGHDSRLHKAEENNYNKLPSCCAYRTGSCHHE